MKKTLFALLAGLLTFPVWGQYEKILADPTVSWAVEIELLIAPEGPGCDWDNTVDSLNRSTVLKSVHTDNSWPFDDPPGLNAYLFHRAQQADQPVFADADLRQKLSADEVLGLFSRTDTVVGFDVESYEEGIMIVRNDIEANDSRLVRVRQLIYYREKTAEFGLVTRAIGPALNDGRVLFWLPVPPPPKNAPDLTDKSITWARRIRGNSASQDLNDLTSLKRPDLPLMRVFIHRVRTDSSVQILDPADWRRPIESVDRANMYNRVDTIVTFDPETFEETIQIVRNQVNPEDLRLGLVQDWYWDDRLQQLIIRLVAVAPMAIRNDPLNFQYAYPLFYRKFD